MSDFILRALLAGSAIAVVSGALGCFVVWRRMAYFGDALAHSSLLGIAFGLALGINLHIGALLSCLLFAAALLWLQQQRFLATDTLLGILAHAMLATGIIALSFLPKTNIDLHGYLFGNILTVTTAEVFYILAGSGVVLILLYRRWAEAILVTMHEDLAKSEGINTFYIRLLLVFLTTLVVALSVFVVGALLVVALFIIPAATARHFAVSPEKMAITAACIGVAMVIIGIYASLWLDIPSGPAIVVSGSLAFVVIAVGVRLFAYRR